MDQAPDLQIADIAPLIGQQALEIVALTKEVQRLRDRVAELEANQIQWPKTISEGVA